MYEGSWAEGKRHGPGTVFLRNGDIFQGEFRHDLKDGPGTHPHTRTPQRAFGLHHEVLLRVHEVLSRDRDREVLLRDREVL